jgi:hypothetical protein
VKSAMQELIPSAELEDDSAGALAFQIPTEDMGSLPGLVKKLENKEIVGVREWGISQSTLEDVFLKVIREINPTSRPTAESRSVSVLL